jgi:acyl dehydratase
MNKEYTDFQVGDKASVKRAFSEDEVIKFSESSGDENPIHFDKEYALKSRFKKRIVQGPFVASIFGGLLGSELPGPGTIYINQTTNFLAPVFIDERINVQVEIIELREDKPIITLRTWAEKESGEIVIDGKATVYFIKPF